MKVSFLQILRHVSFFSSAMLCLSLIFSSCKKIDDLIKKQDVDVTTLTDSLISPIGVLEVPDNSTRLAIIDQAGQILMMDQNGNRSSAPFLDITSRMVPLNRNYDERGLLGLAFHPNYKSNGRFFIHYQAPPRPGGPTPTTQWNNLSRISEFKVSAANPLLADMTSEKVILQWDDPQSNHNGGSIEFGPDGMLYIAIGDGGGANDVGPGHVEDWYPVNAGGNAQNIEANLFGKILRIDVNSGTPYGIPADNPFVNKPGRDEIYAYGFRNPFRFSFDMGGSHQLYAGDAGQVLYEEIDVVKKGGNYGWNVKEATRCFNAANNRTELGSCPSVDVFGIPLSDPVIEMANYQNPQGGRATTIIGGNVYRGKEIRHLYGKYIFGTFSQRAGTPNAELFMATPGGNGLWSFEELIIKTRPQDLGQYLKGFGQDKKGEIYLAVSDVQGPSGNTGKIFKLFAPEQQMTK